MTANRLPLPLLREFAGFKAAGLPADLLGGVTLAVLTKLGLRDLIGEDHIFDSVAEALVALRPAAYRR